VDGPGKYRVKNEGILDGWIRANTQNLMNWPIKPMSGRNRQVECEKRRKQCFNDVVDANSNKGVVVTCGPLAIPEKLELRYMNLLAVKNLTVQIEDQIILETLNFELKPGDTLSIIGPNGAGKTVLLKALLNLIPYSGEVHWSGDVRLGYVPQKIDADRHLPLTYRDLFISKSRILKVATAELDAVSQKVGLTREMLNIPVGHLSGGEFQRALIGFALIGNPNVLLLDEPTASIDETGEEHIYELIHRLQGEYNLAVITVSHDLTFVYRYATKVLCLNRRSVCMGAPREALTPEVLEQLYGPSHGFYQHDHGEHATRQ
jgi:zinc transport system ATP-binding protein